MRFTPLIALAPFLLAACSQEAMGGSETPEQIAPGQDLRRNPFHAEMLLPSDVDAIRSETMIAEPPAPADPAYPLSCRDGKRVCADMADCDDAYHHLQHCGMRRLDRDGDGIPCEKLCGKH
ncbi:excalibur calcium-binding domain-containing protein [Sphingomonas sp. 3-13AW]|uniref:excalibur calcium-binding domain-containing protein n=1 Tax=Sphingomonas sp. 3-13AW TaxID=3050450 RepID=UPI003BB55A42